MTRVDFYLLGGKEDHRERFACRLAEKAWRLGHRVYLLTADAPAAGEMDDLLWTFSQGSFVPHGRLGADDDAGQPVLIGHAEPPAVFRDVLISLAAEVPDWIGRFERVAEIVGTTDQDKQTARERFRHYRERGYPLETHQL